MAEGINYALQWDKDTERLYETGVKNCALYVSCETASKVGSLNYKAGVAWNGITGITESPSGAEETPLYADDAKYLVLRSAEDLGGTIEAYMYPDAWAACDGSMASKGMKIGQQTRKPFALAYVTTVGNDVQSNDFGEKLHIIYNASASPSERAYSTVNDSPEAITFSWEYTTTPINTGIDGVGNKTSMVTLDKCYWDESEKKYVVNEAYETVKAALFGNTNASDESGKVPTLLSPAEIQELVGATFAS